MEVHTAGGLKDGRDHSKQYQCMTDICIGQTNLHADYGNNLCYNVGDVSLQTNEKRLARQADDNLTDSTSMCKV